MDKSMTTSFQSEKTIDRRCPICLAHPGSPCRKSTGEIMVKLHAARYAQYANKPTRKSVGISSSVYDASTGKPRKDRVGVRITW
jgi:hypothetical protein